MHWLRSNVVTLVTCAIALATIFAMFFAAGTWLENRLSHLESRVSTATSESEDRLQHQLGNLEVEIEGLDAKLDTFQYNLDRRLDLIEKDIARLKVRVDRLEVE